MIENLLRIGIACMLGILSAEIARRIVREKSGMPKRAVWDAIAAAVFILLALRYTDIFELFQMLVIACAFVILCATDITQRRIPNACIGIILGIRVLFLVYVCMMGNVSFMQVFLSSLVQAVIVGGIVVVLALILQAHTHHEAIGAGDIKLLFAVAFCFGIKGSILIILISCISALAYTWYIRRYAMPSTFAFGPHIALGCLIMALFGSQIILWYESLLLV